MTSRIDDKLSVSGVGEDYAYSAHQVAAVLNSALAGGGGGDGGGDGGGGSTTNRTHQVATYQTFTNPTTVYYTALKTDLTPLVARTQAGVSLIAQNYRLYGYDQPLADGLTDWIAIWDEGDANNYTLSWEVVGGGTGIVVPPPPPPPPEDDTNVPGAALAMWTATFPTSSLMHLDATGSIGTVEWEIDHVNRPETALIVDYGPLAVGTHNVRLKMSTPDGGINIVRRDVDVPWIGLPLDQAQVDRTNGVPPFGVGLDPWPTTLIGPWRAKNTLNTETGTGDGIPRFVTFDSNHISLLTTTGDTIANPGYRADIDYNNGYDGTAAGYPLGVGFINLTGSIPDGGTSGPVRFYRVEYMLDRTCPGGPDSTATAGNGAPGESFKYQNNFVELHGAVGGAGMWRASPDLTATPFTQGIIFSEQGFGTTGAAEYFDMHTISYGTWYNYVVEYKQSTDNTIGYIRVYRDGVACTGSNAPGGADVTGRFFAVTAMLDVDGTYVPQGFALENYVTHSGRPPTYGDGPIHYRNIRVGPTLASVYP